MAKTKILYTCQQCGSQTTKWTGQCPDCGSWNTLEETKVVVQAKSKRLSGYAGNQLADITPLSQVTSENKTRFSTDLAELDRVLGGGVVEGSVILIGGDPGVGKSTILLQTLCNMSQQHKALYVTGEESLEQVSLRAKRLSLAQDSLDCLTETKVERIIDLALQNKPTVMVVDSIQTIYTECLESAPGSVSQVRDSAAQLVRFAKQNGVAIFLVGHVTKEGALAGPRVLEHMVDTVLYFEGESDSRYRVIRAVKNRFGAVNELGVFAMTEKGLREVNNPSALFLSSYRAVPGNVVMVTWEGSRPLLVEIQALVDESHLGNPRRVSLGLEHNRLAMLLAVLHRHGGVASYDQDVFLNVVGGVKVTETAADLPLLLAVISSLKNKNMPEDLITFGEVGLAGEIRPVQSGSERLREAVKHGFKRAIIPKANAPKKLAGMEMIAVENISQAISAISELFV